MSRRNSVVEFLSSKQDVLGSNPSAGSIIDDIVRQTFQDEAMKIDQEIIAHLEQLEQLEQK